MNKSGMNYAPQSVRNPVVKPGEFVIAAAALDHGHIHGMCRGLIDAGAVLKTVYDPDPRKIDVFRKLFPEIVVARSLEELLSDPQISLVASAAIPSRRCTLGLLVMDAGKDYFTDKAPLTTLQDLEAAKKKVSDTSKKYLVYYSERLHSEAGVLAGELIEAGEIGRVLQVIGLGPHRLSASERPAWFFSRKQSGGILCDLGSHQIEQFLYYAGAKDAEITVSRIANYAHPEFSDFDDFGDMHLVGDNQAAGYFRVDWLTPDGLPSWGDGRTFILGTEGYMELRKYINVATNKSGDHIFLVNHQGERHIEAAGRVGYPFFGKLILDCLERTEHAMTQEHAFKAAQLCVKAQKMAEAVEFAGNRRTN
jgi:predicted dehydrogenase